MLTSRHIALLAHLARWRLTWERYDLDYRPDGLDAKFVSARDAARLIADDAVALSCGMAAFHRPALLYWAIRDRFLATGHPRNLTWCAVGGLGSRGHAPGSLEELGHPGLVTRAILGHTETVKSFLELADQARLDLHTLPQGQLTRLIGAQTEGRLDVTADVGVGTFLDPRTGLGSRVTAHARDQLVAVEANRLRYSLPRLDVHLFNAPAADRHGNIYVRGAACLSEMREGAQAVHRNRGTTIACVAEIVEHDPANVYVPGDWVDAIVVDPGNEQFVSVPQRRCWSMFTPGANVDTEQALGDVRFVNRVARATPRRSRADGALARAAAALVASRLSPGAVVNIGVGLPEEVAKLLYETGLHRQLVLTTEAGAVGGVPTSGLFFGGAVNPHELVSSTTMFARYRRQLDLACLGILEVDSEGNVNVSRRGDAVTDHVGPGGSTDIAHHARTVVFVGSFASGERLRLARGRLHVRRPGRFKFVPSVSEVTFSARHALTRGQRVFYVTHRAVLRLCDRGLELTHVMPGVHIERDVLCAPARILLPRGGVDAVGILGPEVARGSGFSLSLARGSARRDELRQDPAQEQAGTPGRWARSL